MQIIRDEFRGQSMKSKVEEAASRCEPASVGVDKPKWKTPIIEVYDVRDAESATGPANESPISS